jgi:hypothetical protein
MHIYIYIYVYIYKCTLSGICKYKDMFPHIFVYTCMCIYVDIYVVKVCTYIDTFIHLFVSIHIYDMSTSSYMYIHVNKYFLYMYAKKHRHFSLFFPYSHIYINVCLYKYTYM